MDNTLTEEQVRDIVHEEIEERIAKEDLPCEQVEMPIIWTVLWGIFFLGFALGEAAVFAGYPEPTVRWIWTCVFLYFGVVEALAVARRAKGDTLSEHFWRFLYRVEKVDHGGETVCTRTLLPGRVPLVFGFTIYALFIVAAILDIRIEDGQLIRIGFAITGVLYWWLIHLLHRGEQG